MRPSSAPPRGTAPHDARLLRGSGPRVRSSPRSHVFPPRGHKARSVPESRCGCQGRWRESAARASWLGLREQGRFIK